MGNTGKQRALDYHSQGRPGKIEVAATKPCITAQDLSLAYTPGVADPCLEIEKNPEDVFKYTARGNLVGVVSNGTAVLGLGDIGALAGKPVMEGKGVLFKTFADVDVFDIELDSKNVDEIVRTVQLLEPTFGGINLEDIKAPECFEIEERLKETMDIPVFHDDQHGTAIISAAALINAAELADKKMQDLTVVVSGAGAAAIACSNLYIALGVQRKNVTLVDSKGVIYKGRKEGMNKYKDPFAQEDTGRRSLADAMKGADVFLGLSKGGLVSQDMVRSMAPNPIIFALANPEPEISYPDALAARDDVIMASGRSDYPNQVNNVLGFPFIFRGALDVQARKITEEMKMAAAHALADLARLDVPESVSVAYDNQSFTFGREYIIPKPFDSRVLLHVAPAVAMAAGKSGVARKPLENVDAYREQLTRRQSRAQGRLAKAFRRAKKDPQRIVFPEGDSLRIMQAAMDMAEDGLCKPILLGHKDKISRMAEEHHIDLSKMTVIHPAAAENRRAYADNMYALRQRKGVSLRTAQRLTHEPNYYAAMMLRMGDADGLVTGVTEPYAHGARPIMQVLGDGELLAGMMMLVFKNQTKFLVDTTINIDPTAKQLAQIAMMAADRMLQFEEKPRIAMLSYSTFGSGQHQDVLKIREATRIVKELRPELEIDGEMQADIAVNSDLRERDFSFTGLSKDANILVFPDLASSNISYKLLQHLGGAEVVGPLLMGLNYAANVAQRGASPQEITRLTALTAVAAQELAKKK